MINGMRYRSDRIIVPVDEDIVLDKNIKHNISVVVDRLVIKENMATRLTESLETAINLADGKVVVDCNGVEQLFSTKNACSICGYSIDNIVPRMFSFNNPFGACPHCSGLGFLQSVDESKIIRNPDASLFDGALNATGWSYDPGMLKMFYNAVCDNFGLDASMPFKKFPEKAKSTFFSIVVDGRDFTSLCEAQLHSKTKFFLHIFTYTRKSCL